MFRAGTPAETSCDFNERVIGKGLHKKTSFPIGHPGDRNEVVNYVLKPPRREEQADIDNAIERAVDLMPLIEKGEWNAATQRANTKPASSPSQEKP